MAFDLNNEENEETRNHNGANMCIGDWIRTDNGYIGRLYRKFTLYRSKEIVYEIDNENFDDENDGWPIAINRIKKHSKNIIDLIEVGDFLEVLADGSPLRFEVDKLDYKHKLKNIADDIKIKSILTKEQYNTNCYRLEE